ncbi:hypothetical protein L9F63_004541, partial [Diploptera punctata]
EAEDVSNFSQLSPVFRYDGAAVMASQLNGLKSKELKEILQNKREEFEQIWEKTKRTSDSNKPLPKRSRHDETFDTKAKIKNYVRNSQGQERLTNLAVLSIERGLLKQLKQESTFYDLNNVEKVGHTGLPAVDKDVHYSWTNPQETKDQCQLARWVQINGRSLDWSKSMAAPEFQTRWGRSMTVARWVQNNGPSLGRSRLITSQQQPLMNSRLDRWVVSMAFCKLQGKVDQDELPLVSSMLVGPYQWPFASKTVQINCRSCVQINGRSLGKSKPIAAHEFQARWIKSMAALWSSSMSVRELQCRWVQINDRSFLRGLVIPEQWALVGQISNHIGPDQCPNSFAFKVIRCKGESCYDDLDEARKPSSRSSLAITFDNKESSTVAEGRGEEVEEHAHAYIQCFFLKKKRCRSLLAFGCVEDSQSTLKSQFSPPSFTQNQINGTQPIESSMLTLRKNGNNNGNKNSMQLNSINKHLL